MRKWMLYLFIGISQYGYTQEGVLDTVFCTSNNTSYMIFPDSVDLIDIGNPDDFAGQIEDNSVFIKALNPAKESSTILIKMRGEFYYGVLSYKKNNTKFYYDFKKKIKGGSGEESKLVDNKNIEAKTLSKASIQADKLLEEKVMNFMKIKSEINTLGFISEFIDAGVGVIRNDNDKTLIKIIVRNKSSIPYKLDFISFQYFQDQKKGLGKKSKKVPSDVFPLYSPSQLEINPATTSSLGYVIPVFALANNGYLMITFRESQGDRVLKIKIKSNYIQGCKQLEK